jgi:hypothetical protein
LKDSQEFDRVSIVAGVGNDEYNVEAKPAFEAAAEARDLSVALPEIRTSLLSNTLTAAST